MNIRETDLPETGVFRKKIGPEQTRALILISIMAVVAAYGALRLIPYDQVATGDVIAVREVFSVGDIAVYQSEFAFENALGERQATKKLDTAARFIKGDSVRVSYVASMPIMTKIEVLAGQSRTPLVVTTVALRGRT